MLVHERDAQARLARDDAARWREVARDQLDQRRLARAVAPDGSPPVSGGNRERDIAKNLAGAEVDAGVADGNQRHAGTAPETVTAERLR